MSQAWHENNRHSFVIASFYLVMVLAIFIWLCFPLFTPTCHSWMFLIFGIILSIVQAVWSLYHSLQLRNFPCDFDSVFIQVLSACTENCSRFPVQNLHFPQWVEFLVFCSMQLRTGVHKQTPLPHPPSFWVIHFSQIDNCLFSNLRGALSFCKCILRPYNLNVPQFIPLDNQEVCVL